MRHRYNKLKEFNSWIQKKELLIRNLITSLIKNGQIKTTSKKAKVLKSEADKFFSYLVWLFEKNEDLNTARRLAISYIKWFVNNDKDWKKVVNEIVPKYREEWKSDWFIQSFKIWYRKWDWAEEVLLKLV